MELQQERICGLLLGLAVARPDLDIDLLALVIGKEIHQA